MAGIQEGQNGNIPVQVLAEHFNCTVCTDTFKGTTLTPCMHRYCKECICTWLARSGNCPLCKETLEVNMLKPDKGFDKLIESIEEAKEKSEQTQWQSIIQNASADAVETDGISAPVIEVLKAHLKQSLDAQQEFFSDLKADYKRKEGTLRKKFDCLQNDNQQQVEKNETELKVLHERFMRSGELMAQQYDKFLAENLPNFAVLPVSICVNIPTLDTQLSNFQLKPHQSLDDVKSMVLQRMQQKQLAIASWDEDARFFLCSPLAEVPSSEQLISNGHPLDGVSELPNSSAPFMQYSMKSGSKLIITGNFILERDVAKPCFRQTFNEQPTTMNFYRCEDCRKNFICEPCKKLCHEGKNDLIKLIPNGNTKASECSVPHDINVPRKLQGFMGMLLLFCEEIWRQMSAVRQQVTQQLSDL